MGDVVCFKCEGDIEADENYFECDACTTTFHLKCVGVTKQEYNAREKSNRMRLLCDECNLNNPMSIVERNVSTLLKYIHKLDLVLQNQVLAISNNADTMKRMEEQINTMRNEIKSISVRDERTNDNTNQRPTAHSFAEVLRSSILPTVVIKPKQDKQKCEATLQRVRENIVGSELLVRDTKNIRGGGIVISCANAADTMKMKQLIDQNIGNDYDVCLPEIKKPRVKISNISSELTSDEILNDVMNKNDFLRDATIQIKKVMKDKHKDTQDVVAEVDCKSFESMMIARKLFIGWRRCNVVEHIYLKRCFKCCGFSHIASECQHNIACSKCAGSHKSGDCDGKQYLCVNCSAANGKYGLNLATNHHAWSRNCCVLQKRIAKLKEFIQYNPNE